jgi:hypothetical protein
MSELRVASNLRQVQAEVLATLASSHTTREGCPP